MATNETHTQLDSTANGIANVNIFMALCIASFQLCNDKRKEEKNNHTVPTKKKKKHDVRQAFDARERARLCIENAWMGFVLRFFFVCVFAIFYLFPWLSCQNMSTDF